MKVLWIAGRRTEVVHGRSEAQKHNARHFLCVDGGKPLFFDVIPSLLIFFIVSLFFQPSHFVMAFCIVTLWRVRFARKLS